MEERENANKQVYSRCVRYITISSCNCSEDERFDEIIDTMCFFTENITKLLKLWRAGQEGNNRLDFC